MKRILLFYIFSLLIISGVNGQTTEKKQYKAERLTIPPVIDGILNDEAWKNEGTWIDDFTQHEPFNGARASQRTEFKILFDDNNIYGAFKAYDTSPDSIVSRLTRRDNPDGDLVGIIFDSFHDLRTGFLFGTTSGGVKYDQIFTNDGQNEDESWDPNWWVKTSINEEGWVAEMKIPFSQLRFKDNSGDIWGLEVARVLYRKDETSFWQHIPKDAPGLVHLFGELAGLERIRPRKIFDITPYGVTKAETYKTDPSNPFLSKGKRFGLSGGIDAKIGVTNNMTMDLTINPDFGQVEADPSEVNLTAYETFFREKRPFFIEGNNITNFNMGVGDGDVGNDNLFYSRRIGRRPQREPDLDDDMYSDVPTFTTILGAAKLTGKTSNGLSVGFIEAVTDEEKAEIDNHGERSFETVEPLTNYLVGRVQKDFHEGKTLLGGIFTSTNRNLDSDLEEFLHKSAYSGGIDFTQYFKDKNWMVSVSTALSQVNGTKEAIKLTQESSARYYQRPDKDYATFDPDRKSLTGSGGKVQLMKLNGHVNIMGVVTWKSPGFEINDIGYSQNSDQILAVAWAGYNEWEPKGIYRRYNFGADYYTVWDFGGNVTGRGIETNGNMTLKNYWNVWAGLNTNFNSLSGTVLRGGPMMKSPGRIYGWTGFSTDNRKKMQLEFFTNYNKGFSNNYRSLYSQVELTYKPFNYLSFSFEPSFNRSFSKLQYVTDLDYGSNKRYIFSSIDRKTISASVRVNFNLNPDLTLQYWGQPFIATGHYYDHKYITDPMADSYNDRFRIYSGDQIITGSENYSIDEDIDGTVDYSFDKTDFNVQEFLSNFVIRWEFSPGSTVYLVWSQTRSGSTETGRMDYFNNLGDLFDNGIEKLNNVFLVKFSYRFGIR
jgi:hypothetical protein